MKYAGRKLFVVESFRIPVYGKVVVFMLMVSMCAFAYVKGEATEKSIIEVWSKVKAPAPPELHSVKVEPRTTALLILDIEERTTNMERRPRAVASVPKIRQLLEEARKKGLKVVYSTTRSGDREEILLAVKPALDEQVVKASVDKFYNTDLEKILREHGVKKIIVVGTAAEGAVLHTATAAAIRSFEVIVPIDGISSSSLYAEQYVCWHLVNAPGSRKITTLTRVDLIQMSGE